MEISTKLLYFYTLIVLSAADYVEVVPCSKEMPCQAGFLCSAEHACKPTGALLTLFPPTASQALKPVNINNGTLLRIVRKVNKQDEDREMLMLMGTEGIEDDHDRKPMLKRRHNKHKHHLQKHRKNRVTRRDVEVVNLFKGDGIQQLENGSTNALKLSRYSDRVVIAPIMKWLGFRNQDNSGSKSINYRRTKRSIPMTSQFQRALDLLNSGSILGISHRSANTDTVNQLELLEEIKQRLTEEMAKANPAHQHQQQHDLGDSDTNKEELNILKDMAKLFQHKDAGEEHTHHNAHHHEHGQQRQLSSLNGEAGENIGHDHARGHSRSQPDLGHLEDLVLGDVMKAESEGLSKRQGVQLREEVEGLEVLEKQAAEDLIKGSRFEADLSEVEERVKLWGILEQLIEKLKTRFPNTKLSREERSSTVDRANIGSLLSLLQQALNDLQVRTHHKQTNSIAPTTAAMSEPLAMAFDNMGQTEKEGEEIGTIDKDQCQRCEPLVGEEVCGRNGKTYASLCHAVNCAGLRESDITAGRCIDEDECTSNKCTEREECVPMLHGTCLALYSKNGLSRLPCRRYTCVNKEKCGNEVHRAQVCGEDGETYPSLCYLHKAGVQLAYTGSCRPSLCRGEVCGRDGVTYESSCHARAHDVRIDYSGQCFTEDKYSKLVNCATVRDAGKCAQLQCSDPVVPAGACCPVCGGAVIVDPDSPVLSELVASWEEVNHLYVAENFLRNLLSKDEASRCELTASLTNSGSFSVVLTATSAEDHKTCRMASRNLVQTINQKSSTAQDAMLHPMAMKASLINPFNPEATIKGYLLQSQQTIMSKANDLQGQAANRANEAMVEVDREVQDRQYQNAIERGVNKALGQSPPQLCIVTLLAVTYVVVFTM